MPYWVVRSREEFTVRESREWLDALPGALTELGIDLPRVRVAEGPQGTIRVANEAGRIVALIHLGLHEQQAADGLLDKAPALDEGLVMVFDEVLPADEAPVPEGVSEELFELTRAVDEASSDQAAALVALQALMRHVPAEGGAVLLAGVEQEAFEFLAAVGPASRFVSEVRLPFGYGHVGTVHDSGVAVLIHDIAQSAKHWHIVDDATGFRPRSLLAVPVRSSDGRSWGVIELLSTEDDLVSWHVSAAEAVAQSLAERLMAANPQ